jgi:hypothetical protein
MSIEPLEAGDPRHFEIAVPSPAALLVAKLHKIADRQASPRRHDDKDALDVFRLLQSAPPEQLTMGIRKLPAHELSQQITVEAMDQLRQLFGTARSPGSQMAARAPEPLEDPALIAASCAALAADLLTLLTT